MNVSMTVKKEKHDFLFHDRKSMERSKKNAADEESIFQRSN
jgi:hypothetical protein